MSFDRPLAMRQPATGAEDTRHYDRIYVRDLVLDARIGIHAPEKERHQRVRVDVIADILPADRAEDIGRTLCYDYIIDGIRAIVNDGHINLTETLAERIAAHLLAHPLAMRAEVRVEKLDRIPGARLGVHIVREKPAQPAAEVISFEPEG
jgi:dihydroneopterin aldolase